MTTIPAPLVLSDGTCRGRRNGAGPLLGLCIGCARQSDSRAPLEPAAKMAERGGTWQCANRVPVGVAA